ncbi:unnamed protein product [Phytophthora lilii]|uniref:Unnamed protein product n=1 Tax=Phytophthora lilii TaxID=2077276 RepID=A0A9W6TF16_9STRA|nr:unnamed protein product [Phytophthora lilii]
MQQWQVKRQINQIRPSISIRASTALSALLHHLVGPNFITSEGEGAAHDFCVRCARHGDGAAFHLESYKYDDTQCTRLLVLEQAQELEQRPSPWYLAYGDSRVAPGRHECGYASCRWRFQDELLPTNHQDAFTVELQGLLFTQIRIKPIPAKPLENSHIFHS